MTRLANQHEAVNLSQGFPDFDGPDWLKEAACQAIRQGPNQYAASQGNLQLRQALSRKMHRDYALDYEPESEITITCGATEAICASLMGLINPGDEVILFEPFYDSYPAVVAIAGGVARTLPLRAPDFRLDLEALERAITPRTRAVMLNTPTNPTGTVCSLAELEGLAQVLRRHPQVVAITDEVYEHLVFPPHTHVPLATLEGMRERSILISSTSKTLSMTGWKVGYTFAPPQLTQAVRSAHQFITFCAVAPLQQAMALAIDRLPEYLPGQLLEYLARRDYWVETLRGLGLQVSAPAGTYFIVTDVRPLGFPDDWSFCQHVAERHRVAAIPCTAFYSEEHREVGRGLVRWAFCKNLATLEEARRRLQGLRKA